MLLCLFLSLWGISSSRVSVCHRVVLGSSHLQEGFMRRDMEALGLWKSTPELTQHYSAVSNWSKLWWTCPDSRGWNEMQDHSIDKEVRGAVTPSWGNLECLHGPGLSCLNTSLPFEHITFPLPGEMATLSSILDWKILWTEEPDGGTVHGIIESQTQLSMQAVDLNGERGTGRKGLSCWSTSASILPLQ